MAPSSVTYIVRAGLSTDAGEVYALVFAEPDENIRQRTYADVQQMLNAGECYVVETEAELVGVSYIKQPDDQDTEAEFGGAYVAPAHRERGLLTLMGDLALADYRVMHDPPDPMIAHVVVGNAKPRGVLARLGFELRDIDKDQKYPHDEIPGFSHMPVQSDGLIHADTFRLEPAAYEDRLRAAITARTTYTTRDDVLVEIDIQLRSLTSGAMDDLLAELEAADG